MPRSVNEELVRAIKFSPNRHFLLSFGTCLKTLFRGIFLSLLGSGVVFLSLSTSGVVKIKTSFLCSNFGVFSVGSTGFGAFWTSFLFERHFCRNSGKRKRTEEWLYSE